VYKFKKPKASASRLEVEDFEIAKSLADRLQCTSQEAYDLAITSLQEIIYRDRVLAERAGKGKANSYARKLAMRSAGSGRGSSESYRKLYLEAMANYARRPARV